MTQDHGARGHHLLVDLRIAGRDDDLRILRDGAAHELPARVHDIEIGVLRKRLPQQGEQGIAVHAIHRLDRRALADLLEHRSHVAHLGPRTYRDDIGDARGGLLRGGDTGSIHVDEAPRDDSGERQADRQGEQRKLRDDRQPRQRHLARF
jgi:hypothetical protein